jgi:hypothetical protein
MTDEQILEMAKQYDFHYRQTANVLHFARAIAAKQREIDAGICDRFHERMMVPAECAAAIRGQG